MIPLGVRSLRFKVRDVKASLDRNASGHVTIEDLPPAAEGSEGAGRRGKLRLRGETEKGVPIELELGEDNLGLAARIFEYTKRHQPRTLDATITIPGEILREGPTRRALLACDSYASSQRSMDPLRVLDALLAHPDPKVGTFVGGFRDPSGDFRAYRVVGPDGRIFVRRASYDGTKLNLYVPASEAAVVKKLEEVKGSSARYANIEIIPFEDGALSSLEKRLELRFDRPGVIWVSSRCPLLPEIRDDGYFVPGARFGTEAYYHDARINAPGARSTIEALLAEGTAEGHREAETVLSALRGTTNVLINQIHTLGKALNANLTVYLGRSQPPCLTTCIKETYEAWLKLARGNAEETARAKIWLGWAVDAAAKEYRDVWTAPPRLDPRTGLSRYLDEAPSEAPEERPGHYQGVEWSAEDIAADASIREHGWDSHVGALALVGPDRGRPRQHQILPVCLNSLLFKYEVDLGELSRELGRPKESGEWLARAARRKETIDRLMWNEETGLYSDLLFIGAEGYVRNGYEDLRSYLPMWAGIVEKGSAKAQRMAQRIDDFLRKGGLANATESSWNEARASNPDFVDRCQWGHKDIGWPISNYETSIALRRLGFTEKADQIAYRWCWMVQRAMERNGGLQYSAAGGYEAPIMEKMDVVHLALGGIADLGYGNQGAGFEGEGGGFRWGYDAFKLLGRSLPPKLQDALANQADPDLLFSDEIKLAKYRT